MAYSYQDEHVIATITYLLYLIHANVTDKEEMEASRRQREEEWKSRAAEKDGNIEELRQRVLELQKAEKESEKQLKRV